MNVLFFVRDVFLFYFRLKLSKAHNCDLYVFINSDLVIMRFSLVYLLIICGFKRIFQIKEGSTLVCSAHFKPEDMYVTMAGLTRLKT